MVRLAANRLPARPGGIRLAHLLTTLGGIEGEVTITRLGDDRFYLNSSIMAEQHDQDWLRHHVLPGEQVTVTDLTNQTGILAVTGPRSRELLRQLTGADLTTPGFPWLTGQEIEVAGVSCLALRVSYVGELGWELHHRIEEMPGLYAAIWEAGKGLGLTDFGAYAMNVMRIEKAYKAHGFELTTEITPVEADIERFVDYRKDFQGKAATLERRNGELAWVLVYGEMDAVDADCRGNEPVYGEGNMMGLTTSGAYGYSVGKSLFFAYVHPDYRTPGSEFEIRVMEERRRARVLSGPAWDPRSERLRV